MEKGLKHAILFLVGTLVITWAFYFPIPLLGWSPYTFPGMIFLIIGGSVPTWLGVILVLTTYDKAQRKDYFERIVQLRRIKPVGWIVLIFMFPAIVALSVALSLLLGGTMPEALNLKAILVNPLVWFPLVSLSFLSGPFSEEFGWRGFALDPLLKKFGFTGSGIILGLVWGIWHLPLFFMPQTWHGKIGFVFTGFYLFVLFSVGMTWIMSWVYVKSKRSILTALLLHLSSNFSGQLLEGTDATFTLIRSILVCVIGAGIVIYVLSAKKDAPFNYQLETKLVS